MDPLTFWVAVIGAACISCIVTSSIYGKWLEEVEDANWRLQQEINRLRSEHAEP